MFDLESSEEEIRELKISEEQKIYEKRKDEKRERERDIFLERGRERERERDIFIERGRKIEREGRQRNSN